jgi:subtilisin family serine protease
MGLSPLDAPSTPRQNAMKKHFALTFVVSLLVTAELLLAQGGRGDLLRSQQPIANQYIAVLAGGDDPLSIALQSEARYHGRLRHVYRNALRGFAIQLTAADAVALSRDTRILYVEEDGSVHAGSPGVQRPSSASGPAPTPQRSPDGSTADDAASVPVYVHVVDTGIRSTHVEFGGRAFNAGDFVDDDGDGDPQDLANDDADPKTPDGTDCNGHGTHVAAAIAGATYGVATSATVLSYRVLDCTGAGATSAVIAALDLAASDARRPAVLHIGFAAAPSTALDSAVRSVIAAGITVVAAAGDGNADAGTSSPARVSEAVTVGATGSDGSRADFSNVGGVIDAFAPGVAIASAWFTSDVATATLSGTAMASAHVAGTVARSLSLTSAATTTQPGDRPVNAVTAAATRDSSSTGTASLLVGASSFTALAGGATASFVGSDATTLGNWQGTYGSQGSVVVGDVASIPGGSVVPTNAASWTWAASTSDVRALRKTGSSGRVAAGWYTTSGFIDITPGDAGTHRVTLYVVDWDSGSRSQQVDILDPNTGSVLDSRTVSEFSGGQYLTWRVTGPVRIGLTRLAGPNAVVSGVFIDADAGSPGPSQGGSSAAFVGVDTTTRGNWKGTFGTIGSSLTDDETRLPAGASIVPASAATWTWAGSTSDSRGLQRTGSTARLAAAWYTAPGPFTVDVSTGGAASYRVTLYVVDWDSGSRSQQVDVLDAATGTVLDQRTMSGFSNGQYFTWRVTGAVRIRVTALGGPNAVVSGIFIDSDVSAPPSGGGSGTGGSSAAFAGIDTATGGNWKGLFGTLGSALINDETRLPSGATVVPANTATWTWAGSTSDARALQRTSSTGRLAAAWYASPGPFTIDVATGDATPHRVTVYVVDWDFGARAERIDILDPATKAVLDSETISDFGNGQYVTWLVTGPVRIQVTRVSGANAIVSAVFLDPATAGNQPPGVTVTAPAAGTTFLSPASITLSANAIDADGVASVTFYAGDTPIGTAFSRPYSITWTNAVAGTYPIVAVALDTTGAWTASEAVPITVVSSMKAAFTASADHDTLVTSYLLEVFEVGADPWSAAPVATQNLGKPKVVNGDCSVDISATLRSLPPGSYIATVSSVGAEGISRSAPSAMFFR